MLHSSGGVHTGEPSACHLTGRFHHTKEYIYFLNSEALDALGISFCLMLDDFVSIGMPLGTHEIVKTYTLY